MLLLGAKSITVEGIAVFPDHADPDQFWYLPGPVSLARRKPDNFAQFTFIKFKPAAVAGGAKGGGFLMFEVNLRLDPVLERRIVAKLSGLARGTPRLSVAPFDEGSVRCVALNLEGEGGTSATKAPPGAFNAVEQILGASVPSLQGDNSAAFSLTLSQEGAIIIEQAFKQGTAPVGVIYDLKFTAIRPALDVKITADFKRIYQHFSASLSAKYYFVKVGIDAAFEELVQNGAIKIEVTNFTGSEDMNQKEKWALDFFKEKLLTDWFEPTLKPGELAGGAATTTLSPDAPAGGPATSKPPATSGGQQGGGQQGGGQQGGGQQGGGQPSGGQQTPVTTGAVTTGAAAAGPRPPAVLVIESTNPTPPPAGHNVTHTPSSEGNNETITVTGNNPVVRVDGEARQLNASGQLTIDVQPSSTHTIAVEYPAGPAVTETFDLFFEYDLPLKSGWSTNPPSASYNRYLNNAPMPNDIPFKGSTAPSGNTSLKGADALRDWARNRLAAPKEVDLDAHASFEGHAEKVNYNLELSVRRLSVAAGIIGNLAQVRHMAATGQQDAQTNGRVSTPTQGVRNQDRIVHIKGNVDSGTQPATINARISRGPVPTATPTPTGTTPPTPTPTGTTPPTPTPTVTPTPTKTTSPTPTPTIIPPGLTAGAPELALKLKFIRQEEQKTLTFEYHRSDAVRRTYAPQGFFGLLLADLLDKERHFVEVDLDDPFFRVFTVTIDAPIDFRRIGLTSAQVALDYGSAVDEVNHKHGDFIFDAQNNAEKKFEVFMNATRDTSYLYSVQYHFDPTSDWDGTKFTYEIPPKRTEDRTLLLNPFEAIGFLEVQVFPNQLDAGVIESTDAHLSHPDGAVVQEKIINVTPVSAPQFWRVRLDEPSARDYTYHLVHHLKDGTVKQTDPVVTRATALPVDDPFERPLEVDFIPLFDPSTTRMVFIDVEYNDPANNYRREERLTLQGEARAPVHLRLSLMDPKQRTFRYRLTFVGVNNQMNRGAFIESTETLIGVAQ